VNSNILITLFCCLVLTSLTYAREAKVSFYYKTNLHFEAKKTFEIKNEKTKINGIKISNSTLVPYQGSVSRILQVLKDGSTQCAAGGYIHKVQIDKKPIQESRGCLTTSQFESLSKAFQTIESTL
jgi:hypothetical protein